LGWLRKAASDSVKQFLIEAKVLDSDGKKAHPSLKAKSPKRSSNSVAYGLEHRVEALNYAMQFAREMNTELADVFIGM
jgi:hypothetical protein